MTGSWSTVTLGDLTADTRPICYGVLKPGPFVPSGTPLLRIQDLAGDRVNVERVHRISSELDQEFSRSRLRGGEILLSIQGTIGRVAICPESLAGANISRTLAVIQPDARVEPRFLRLYLLYVTAGAGYKTGGTTRASLNISTIREMRVPLPPIEEQRRIVDMLEDHLSRIDAGAGSMELASRRVIGVRASQLERLVAPDPEGLVLPVGALADGGIFCDGDWVETKDQDPAGSVRLTQLADVGVGTFRDRSDRWMRPEQARALACTYLSAGDILVARMPEPLARACLVPPSIGSAVTAVDVAILRIQRPDVDPAWLMWAMNSPTFHSMAVRLQSGTTRKRISRKNLAAIPVALPPIAEQRDRVATLVRVMDGLDHLASACKDAEIRAAALRRSLLSTALSGRLTGTKSDDSIQELGDV